jgi:hypothetical protein
VDASHETFIPSSYILKCCASTHPDNLFPVPGKHLPKRISSFPDVSLNKRNASDS